MRETIETKQGRAQTPGHPSARRPYGLAPNPSTVGEGLAREQPGQHEPVSAAEFFLPVALLARTLSDGNRLRILQLLSGGRKSVTGIGEELNLSQPLVSHHLRELKRSLLVKIERDGPFIYYELSDSRILEIIRTLRTVSKDLLSAGKIS